MQCLMSRTWPLHLNYDIKRFAGTPKHICLDFYSAPNSHSNDNWARSSGLHFAARCNISAFEAICTTTLFAKCMTTRSRLVSSWAARPSDRGRGNFYKDLKGLTWLAITIWIMVREQRPRNRVESPTTGKSSNYYLTTCSRSSSCEM